MVVLSATSGVLTYPMGAKLAWVVILREKVHLAASCWWCSSTVCARSRRCSHRRRAYSNTYKLSAT